jgi:hypothetical protein
MPAVGPLQKADRRAASEAPGGAMVRRAVRWFRRDRRNADVAANR